MRREGFESGRSHGHCRVAKVSGPRRAGGRRAGVVATDGIVHCGRPPGERLPPVLVRVVVDRGLGPDPGRRPPPGPATPAVRLPLLRGLGVYLPPSLRRRAASHRAGGLDYRCVALVVLDERHVPLGEVRGIATYTRLSNLKSRGLVHGLKVETMGKPVLFADGADSPGDVVAGRTAPTAPSSVDTGPGRRTSGRPPRLLRGRDRSWGGGWAAAFRELPPVAPQRGRSRGLVPPGPLRRCHLPESLLERNPRSLPPALGPTLRVASVLLPDSPSDSSASSSSLAWLLVVIEPFSVQKWVVHPGGIAARSSVFRLGRARYHETRDLTRVELRRLPLTRPGRVHSPGRTTRRTKSRARSAWSARTARTCS